MKSKLMFGAILGGFTLLISMVRLRAIQKWDGHLPKFVGNGTVPMVDMKGVSK